MYICNEPYPYLVKHKSLSVSSIVIHHYIVHSSLPLLIWKFHSHSEKTSHHRLSIYLIILISVSIESSIRVANSCSYGEHFNQLECRTFLQFCGPLISQTLVPTLLKQASFPSSTSGVLLYICSMSICILLSLSSFSSKIFGHMRDLSNLHILRLAVGGVQHVLTDV